MASSVPPAGGVAVAPIDTGPGSTIVESRGLVNATVPTFGTTEKIAGSLVVTKPFPSVTRTVRERWPLPLAVQDTA